MPAVGKSTVGILLAKKMGFGFIDTDISIQTGQRRTLARIIAQKGLDEFLKIEENYILKVHCSRHVIATGGSVVYKKKAMDYLASHSTIVYLSIELELLLTRLLDLESRGVAILPGKSIKDLYKERTPLYETYQNIKIDCGTMMPDEIVEAISRKLHRP
ncbi:MAG: shikimate kinase [Desulfobacteraceae bacterium]|nr:shikimate kinase [Desulfobacteraceae bacterium]